MSIFTRGFSGRRSADDDRLPPGQYLTGDFPVLSAGPTPRVPLDAWRFTVRTESDQGHGGPGRSSPRSRSRTVTVDLHCVTGWTKLDTVGAGSPSTPCSTTSRPRPTSPWCTATAGTPPTCRSRTCSTARPGSPSSTTATSSPPSTAGRPACWSRTCTSGSPPSGSADRPHAPGRAGLLGAARLPRLRRPVARAAVPGGLTARRTWRPADLAERRPETDTATTLVLRVPRLAGSPRRPARRRAAHRRGRLPGLAQLLARRARPDGDRSRSPCSAWPTARSRRSSPTTSRSATRSRSRGPLGGWFVWRPEHPEPVLLVAGGSGVVPLMAMVRARAGASRAPFRLVYSVRTPADRIYATELRRRAGEDGGLDVAWVHTRAAPDGDPRPPGRCGPTTWPPTAGRPTSRPPATSAAPPASSRPRRRCSSTAGHDPARIRTERFGGA